jgi:hypothetical protein
MLQERTANKKDDSTKDLILIVLIVLVFVFIKRIFTFLAGLPMPWNTIGQGALFIGLIAGCYLFFTKRISDFRYSVIYHQPGEGETNIFGDEQKYPWPEGTVLFERMVANKGRLLVTVEPSELVALVEPGETYEEKTTAFRTEHFSGKAWRKSHTLIYRRKNKLYATLFSPSQEMAAHIRNAIDANAAR